MNNWTASSWLKQKRKNVRSPVLNQKLLKMLSLAACPPVPLLRPSPLIFILLCKLWIFSFVSFYFSVLPFWDMLLHELGISSKSLQLVISFLTLIVAFIQIMVSFLNFMAKMLEMVIQKLLNDFVVMWLFVMELYVLLEHLPVLYFRFWLLPKVMTKMGQTHGWWIGGTRGHG